MGIHPALFLVGTLFLFWLASALGSWLRLRREQLIGAEKDTFRTVEGAVLTLTGLLLGFTFSMAVNRYEHRGDLEIQEADAIGTLWQRSATLAEPARSEEQRLIREYVPTRVEFLASGGSMKRLQASLDQTAVLQGRMWAIASDYARGHADSITSLFLSAMGDSFSRSEERTAAFENRIPLAAWIILLFVGAVRPSHLPSERAPSWLATAASYWACRRSCSRIRRRASWTSCRVFPFESTPTKTI
jgi:hypothetical protein